MTKDCCSKTALRLPAPVSRRAAVFVVLALTLAGAGCASKSQDAAAPGGTSSGKPVGVTPLGAPPEATKSIRASQEMGQAMQRNATANGEAMSKATRP